MNFSLIICTYKRPQALLTLLQSVKQQTLYPNEILIIDGSTNTDTKAVLNQNSFENIKYYLVSKEDRGLTRQRNFGIGKTAHESEIICFLDDDTVLDSNYFKELITTYKDFPNALGIGGYISNEDNWEKVKNDYIPKIKEFYYDGWKKKDGSRFVLRKKLNLAHDKNLNEFLIEL